MTIFQVTHKASLYLQQIRNVFYYETQVGDPSTSEWQDVVDEIRTDFVGDLLIRLVEQYIWGGIDVREVSALGLPSVEYIPTAGSIAGTNTGDGYATQVAVLVSVQGLTSKPRRARSYLAGWAETQIDLSQVNEQTRDAAETFIDLQSVLNAGGTNPLQRVSAQWNTSHTLVTAWNNIAGRPAKASIIPATQRRRRIGVGI